MDLLLPRRHSMISEGEEEEEEGTAAFPRVAMKVPPRPPQVTLSQCWTGSLQGFWDFPVPRARKSCPERPQLPDFPRSRAGLALAVRGWSHGGPGPSPGGVHRTFPEPGGWRCSQEFLLGEIKGRVRGNKGEK